MANVVQLQGRLTLGPSSPVTDTTFPGGSTAIQFSLRPSQKQAPLSTGAMVRSVSSPSSYVQLDGVGTGETITQANTLFVHTTIPMLLRLTTYSGSGDVVSVIPIDGVFIAEFDKSKYLKLVEIQGSGIVEWLISGDV